MLALWHVIHYYYTDEGNWNYSFGRLSRWQPDEWWQPSVFSQCRHDQQDGCKQNGGEGGALSLATIFEFDTLSVPIINVESRDNSNSFPEMFGSPLTNNPAWFR